MKPQRNKWNSGFTIIELMITLIIVAILVALAYPSYVDYVRKSKRGEAQQLLMNWSINQEIWRSNNPAYATAAQLPVPTHDHYDFTLPVAPAATTYILQAAAKAGDDQLKDKAKDGTPCSTLNINNAGQKYSAGDTTKLICWN
jgi:type IV pilus assembly protein PilE